MKALQSDLSDSYYSVGRLMIDSDREIAIEHIKKALSLQTELYNAAQDKFKNSYEIMKKSGKEYGIIITGD